MITNLFSIFDPATNIRNSFNWLSLILWVLFIPISYWFIPNRFNKLILNLVNYIFSEFKPLVLKTPFTLIISVSLFFIILFNNAPGLLPFIFTGTRHMRITLRLAFPLWLGIITHGWMFNTSNLLIHLIPNGTPTILIPFIVLIETIRNIIRPLTLAIRLAANIIAGHLLITLLSSATRLCPLYLDPFLFFGQYSLIGLEIAVASIQAYVFRVLITLYTAERVR